MSLEFCTSDKQVVLLPPSGDVDALVLPPPPPPSQCGLGSWDLPSSVLLMKHSQLIFKTEASLCSFISSTQFPVCSSSYSNILPISWCEITFPCCSVRCPDTVLPCSPGSFESLHWCIAFSSLDLWILLLTSMCCVCVCVCVCVIWTVFLWPNIWKTRFL